MKFKVKIDIVRAFSIIKFKHSPLKTVERLASLHRLQPVPIVGDRVEIPRTCSEGDAITKFVAWQVPSIMWQQAVINVYRLSVLWLFGLIAGRCRLLHHQRAHLSELQLLLSFSEIYQRFLG